MTILNKYNKYLHYEDMKIMKYHYEDIYYKLEHGEQEAGTSNYEEEPLSNIEYENTSTKNRVMAKPVTPTDPIEALAPLCSPL